MMREIFSLHHFPPFRGPLLLGHDFLANSQGQDFTGHTLRTLKSQGVSSRGSWGERLFPERHKWEVGPQAGIIWDDPLHRSKDGAR